MNNKALKFDKIKLYCVSPLLSIRLYLYIYYKLSYCLFVCGLVSLCVTELLPNEGSNLNKWGIKFKVSLPGMSARIFLQIGGFIN